jgi:hypothetical protein
VRTLWGGDWRGSLSPISFTENGTDPFSYPQEGWENRAVTEGKFLHSARQGSRALDFTKTGQEPNGIKLTQVATYKQSMLWAKTNRNTFNSKPRAVTA